MLLSKDERVSNLLDGQQFASKVEKSTQKPQHEGTEESKENCDLASSLLARTLDMQQPTLFND